MSLERHDNASTATLANVFSARSGRGTLRARDESLARITPKRSLADRFQDARLFDGIVMIISTSDPCALSWLSFRSS